MAHRDFENPAVDESEPGPTFTLLGRKFQCMVQPAPGVISDIAAVTAMGKIGTGAMSSFIRNVLVPADEGAWDELVYDKKVVINKETIGDIFDFITTEYFRRPQERPSGSPAGSPETEES